MLNIFWFRRDLRLEDNAGLYHALRAGLPVLPVFIFDTGILDKLNDRSDPRLGFIHDTIKQLSARLEELGTTLLIRHGKPADIWAELAQLFPIQTVFANRDYEPYAIARDESVKNLLAAQQIGFKTYKDHCIFEHLEVAKSDNSPYSVFTPYSKQWLRVLESKKDKKGAHFYTKSYPTEAYFANFFAHLPTGIPSLERLGFSLSQIPIPSAEIPTEILKNYTEGRENPAQKGTSRLGIHLRFGTISIRKLAQIAQKTNQTFLNELIWRDFYLMILANYPHVVKSGFRPDYDRISWLNNPQDFELWKAGKTGYPLVDAGIRELNKTGFMHNRVRMVVASFLTKHLLVHWSWGEAYFAEKLLDFELASNNGGWQWASGSGTDAAPYFRIFNPQAQQEKFDSKFAYIRRWVPEYGTDKYSKPMIAHVIARERCLAAYKKVLKPTETVSNTQSELDFG